MSNQPAEYRLADWLTDTKAWRPARSVAIGALRRLGAMDQRAYDAVAGWSSPALDAPLREVSRFANFSKPWLLTAGILAVAGGPTGRRAALTGVAAIAATSLMVNQPMKLAAYFCDSFLISIANHRDDQPLGSIHCQANVNFVQ